MRTVEFGDEVREMQSADKGKVTSILGQQANLLVLHCVQLAHVTFTSHV